MTYSLKDLYGGGLSSTLATSENTIPEDTENQHYADNTAENDQGMKVKVDKKMIWGAVLLFVGVMILMDIIDKL
jgi:hypothetical protein